ncbi:PREDICTED: uncharacterized protein LOC109583711, partial [Amphimedon queenslandica]
STNIDLVCSTNYQSKTGLPYPLVGSAKDYGVNFIPNYITDFSCPADSSYADSSCNYTTNTQSCAGYSGPSIVTCINGPDDCGSGNIQIQQGSYGYGHLNNNQYLVTGYPQICVTYDYIPICRDGVSEEELRYICYRTGYYGYTLGPVIGSESNFTAPNSTYSATNLSCPVFSEYDNCNYTTFNGNCDTRGGPILLTCLQVPSVCRHGDVRIVDGPNNYTGRPEFCYFGTWRSICGIGFDLYDAAVTCSLAGFNHDLARNLSAGSYGYNNLPPVLAGLQCTGKEGSFSNCTPINGDLLSSCNYTQAAAVACEPVILAINTTINGTATLGPNTNLTLTCTLDYQFLSGDFQLNSIGWYRNGARLSSVSGRYNLTESEVEQYRCRYYGYYGCDNETVAVRLVLAFENLMLSDAGEYDCRVNLTDFNVSRTVVNSTTETLNIIRDGTSSTSSVIVSTSVSTEVFSSTIEPSTTSVSTGVFTSTIELSTTSVSTEVFSSTIEPSTTSVSTEVFSSTIEPSTTSVSTGVFTSTIGPSTTSVSTEVFSSTIEPSTTSVSTEVFSSTIGPSTTSVSTGVFTSTIEPSTTSVSTEVFSSTIELSTTSVSTEVFTSTTSFSFSSSVSISASSFSVTPTPSSTPAVGEPCYSTNNARFGNASRFTFYPGSQSVYTGRVEVCPRSRVYTPVCNDAINDQFAYAFCRRINYNSYPVYELLIGTESDYSVYNTTSVITNITCSYSSLSSCTYTTDSTNCSSYGGVAIFSCRENVTTSTSECSDGNSVRLLNYTRVYNRYADFETVSSGRVSGCVNSQYVDICADGNSDLEAIAQRACNDRDYNSRATIIPWTSDYSMSSSGIVLRNVSCGSDVYSLQGCTYEISNITECPSGILAVTCETTCSNGRTRMVNERVEYTSNGSARVSGRLEICINRDWVSVCDDDTLSEPLADIACNSIGNGFNSGVFLPSNTSLYGSNDRVYTNFTCEFGDWTSYIYNCINDARPANDSAECVNKNAVIQCFRPSRSCYSSYQSLYYSSFITTADGRYGFIGRISTCINMQEAVYCNNTITSSNIDLVCSGNYQSRTGLPYPLVGSAKDYGVNFIPNYITGFSCPADSPYADSSCNYTTNTQSCTGYGGPSIVTCINGPYSCGSGNIQIRQGSYGSGRLNNNQYLVTGYPQICVTYDYIPICRDGVSEEELRYICYRTGYYGYTLGPVIGSESNFTAPNSTYSATNLSCPIFSEYDNCNYTTFNGNCDTRGGPILLTCLQVPSVCRHGDVRIVDGPNNYTGRPEFCYFGTWRSICGIGFDLYDASVTCSLAGFNHDLARNLSAGSYGYNNLPPVLAGLQCTGREGSFSNCTPINGDLLSSCNYTQAAAVACEPVILAINTTINGTATLGPNTNLTLTCTLDYQFLSGDFQLNSIGWYRNGARLSSVSGRYNLTESEVEQYRCGYYGYYRCDNETVAVRLVLAFENLMLSDAGEYDCRVNLTDFNVSRTVVNSTTETLNIIAGPQLISSPQNYTVINGSNVMFNCSFTSELMMTAQWYYASLTGTTNGSPLTSGVRLVVSPTVYNGVNQYSTSLSINTAMVPDIGVYQCVGSSTNGIATGYGSLIVLVAGTIDVTAVAQSIEEGNTLTLTCTVSSSYPEVSTFSWFRGSSLITLTNRVTISTGSTIDTSTGLYTSTSQLMIQNTLTGDSGQYLCRVPPVFSLPSLLDRIAVSITPRNECIIDGGSTPCVNGYCVDEVNDYYCVCPDNFFGRNCETPVVINSAPVIVTPPMDQDVPLGSLVNLTCVATGAPQPVITWYLEGTLIPGANSPIYIIDSIQPAQRGTYSCRAMNSEGMVQATATVTINDIRQYVTTLTASSSRKRQVQLPPAIEAVYNQTRDTLVGNELSPGSGIIVADITYALASDGAGVLFIFTLRVPPMANTDGITNSLNALTADIAANYPGISFSPVMRFDGCSPETLPVTAGSSLNIMWPEVDVRVVARPICPCGDITTNFGAVGIRRCNGTFSAPAVWLTPNTTQCIFDQTTTRLCQLSMNDNAEEVATQLTNITTNTQEIDPVDIGLIGTLAEEVAEDASDPEVLDSLMSTMNNILDAPDSVLEESQQSSNGSQRIVNVIEAMARTANITRGGSVTVVRPNVAIEAQAVEASTFNGAEFSIGTTSTGTLDENTTSSSTNVNSVSIPPTLLTNVGVNGSARIGFSAITNSKLFQPRDTSSNTPPVRVESIVLSIDIYIDGGSRVTVQELSDPITLSFTITLNTGSSRRRRQATPSNTISECAFWDTTSFTWSTTGITTVPTATGVNCIVTHLSSFAVVQRDAPVSSSTTPTPTPTGVTPPTEPVTEEYSPEPILFIGLIISIVLILVAVIGHLASDAQRHCPEGRLLATSHITLIILYFVFVLATAATYTDSTGFCGTFAGLFHYFSLVYFVWLMFEGLFYAVKLRMGIGGNAFTRHYFIVSLVFALILPAVIVIISAALGYN